MMKPPTIKDIARTLNISTSTVSRALRNAPDVNPETKKAVLELSSEINYQPNKLALSFQQNQTHTIGVIVPNLDHTMSAMIRGIDEVALEAGYTVMVCQSNESFGRETVNARRLLNSLVDGLIISVSSETKMFEHLRKIQNMNMPLVLFDRASPDIQAPRVRLDNKEGGYIATRHLTEEGYKRIAILAGPKNLEISNQRMEGYLAALKRSRIKPEPALIRHCDFNQDDAMRATRELLQLKQRPDAIFCISDRMAIGAMLAIKEAGIKMPSEIGLVGFNNEPVVSLVTPGITSVEQPSFELGKATARLFIERMHKEEDMNDVEIIFKPTLMIRESSGRKGSKHE